MAAIVAGNTEIGLRRVGSTVIIPQDPRAKLMFYLNCIRQVLSLDDNNLDRLCDYRNYHLLTDAEIDALILLCLLLNPEKLKDKCIFEDEELCGDLLTQFYELTAVQNRFLVTDTVLLGSQQSHVKKIMTYKRPFLLNYYLHPIAVLANRSESQGSGNRQPIRTQPAISYPQQSRPTAIVTQPIPRTTTNYSNYTSVSR